MEGIQCQLRGWFTDRLCGDDSDRHADFHHLSGRKICTITFLTNAAHAQTRQWRPDLDLIDSDILYDFHILFSQKLSLREYDILFFVKDIFSKYPAADNMEEILAIQFRLLFGECHISFAATILLPNDHFLRCITKLSRKVS